jgi:hypothetical protein
MCEHVLEVLFCLGDGKSLDGLGSLIGILIMDAEVSARRLGDCVIAKRYPWRWRGFWSTLSCPLFVNINNQY